MLFATVRQRKTYVKRPETVIRNGVNVDLLKLEMDDEWAEMDSIKVIFTLKYQVAVEKDEEQEDGNTIKVTAYEDKEIAKEMLYEYGKTVVVPWECLTETGLLSVSCTGYVGSEKVMTTMMADSFWTVVQNGPMEGDQPMEPTESLYDQIVAAAGRANQAAAAAEKIGAQLESDRDNGNFNGITPTVEVARVTTGTAGSEAKVENVGTETDVKLAFSIPRGAEGAAGRGVRSMVYEDGQWIVTYTDGVKQVVGGEAADNLQYPYVLDVLFHDGVLGVEYATDETHRYTKEITLNYKLSEAIEDEEHRTVTDAKILAWDGKVDMAVENLNSIPETGQLLATFTNGGFVFIDVLPSVSEAPEGSFLRTGTDGTMYWDALTNLAEEGA